MSTTPSMPPLDWVNGRPEDLRRQYAARRASMADQVAPDVDILPDGPILTFRPKSAAPKAAVLYFHGGGWMVGSPSTHVTLCSWLAALSGRRIVSVPYRLAPEHAYPAQREDAKAALAAMLRHEKRPVFVAGDSAGAAMAFWAETGASDVLGVIGFYGAFGVTESPSLQRYSDRNSSGLVQEDILSMYGHLRVEDAGTLRTDIGSEGAPALLIAAGADPLRDDSYVLSQQFQTRACDVWEAPGQAHAFLQGAGISAIARHWLRQTAFWMDQRG